VSSVGTPLVDSEELVVPNCREIISGIPPDSVTWSGGAVGNISCRGSLNHGRRSSPGAEGEGLGSSMNSSILINYP
jgi:hypothetical protein